MSKKNYISYFDKFYALQADVQEKILLAIGLLVESRSKYLAPVDFGKLRQSIGNIVDMDDYLVYIGSTLEYAIFVEKGTGTHATGGRQTTWVYNDNIDSNS